MSGQAGDASPTGGHPRWAGPAAVAAIGVTALVATWPASGAGLTAAATALAEASGRVSDGVAVWEGWRPLAGAWPLVTPGGAHALSALMWAALALLVFGAGRRLGLSLAGAAIVAIGFAAHPVGGAIAGDLAARGTLWALLGFTGAMWAGLAASRHWAWAAAAGLFAAVGVLGHPVAALAAPALAMALWARGGPAMARQPALLAVAAVSLLGLVLAAALGAAPAGASTGGAIGALALVGRAARLALTGAPLTREPWDLAESPSLSDDAVFIGAFALLGALAVLFRTRRPGLRVGAVTALLTLIVLAWPSVTLASAQPVGVVALVTVGFAWALGALVPARGLIAAPIALVAALSLTLALPRAVDHFASEATATAHELRVAPNATPLRRAVASRELAAGRTRTALTLLEGHDGPGLAVLRMRALLALHRWGEAARLLTDAPADEVAPMRCALATARRDVTAERDCRAAVALAPDDVSSQAALAEAVGLLGRPAEAEVILRELVAADGGPEAWAALIAHFERFDWVREAVGAAEEWLAARPGDLAVRARLGSLLLRKVRGDLLDKRFDEAAAAARRLLELEPRRGEARYYLADALDGLGDAAGATAAREAAQALGIAPPPPPDAMPGLPQGIPAGAPIGRPHPPGR